MTSYDDLTVLLADLVRIPSVNPRGRPVSDTEPAEGPLADFVAGWLQYRGVQVSCAEVLPGRNNVLGVVRGQRPELLVLEAHLDTVEIDGMTVEPFGAEIRGGRMYGRGTCDTKGSLAAYMLAIAELAAGDPPPVSVALAATVDEEHHYRGVVGLLDELEGLGHRCVGAIVGEPTGLAMATAHRGVVRFTVRVQGRAGHTSRPAEAVNAIALAGRLVEQVETVAPSTVMHPLLGRATRTVTRIAGGSGPNVVPGVCELDIDRRTLPGEDPRQVWQDTLTELSGLLPGRVSAPEPYTVDYALDTAEGCVLVCVMRAALDARKLPVAALGMPFCTDASKFALRGIDAVVLGPGSIDDAHTADESVDLAEVRTTAGLVADVARSAHWQSEDPA